MPRLGVPRTIWCGRASGRRAIGFASVPTSSVRKTDCSCGARASTASSTTVNELAEVIWRKVHGADSRLNLVSDPPYEHDVQMRVPDVRKATEVLGFEASTPLEDVLDEVIPWIRDEIEAGRI